MSCGERFGTFSHDFGKKRHIFRFISKAVFHIGSPRCRVEAPNLPQCSRYTQLLPKQLSFPPSPLNSVYIEDVGVLHGAYIEYLDIAWRKAIIAQSLLAMLNVVLEQLLLLGDCLESFQHFLAGDRAYCHRKLWIEDCFLLGEVLPSLHDDIAVLGIEFNRIALPFELLARDECRSRSTEEVDDEIIGL